MIIGREVKDNTKLSFRFWNEENIDNQELSVESLNGYRIILNYTTKGVLYK